MVTVTSLYLVMTTGEYSMYACDFCDILQGAACVTGAV